MEHAERQFMLEHLTAWCNGYARSDEGAADALRNRIVRWLDANGEWGYAFNNGWPNTLDRVQEWEAYNRDLAQRCRTKPFQVAVSPYRD